MKGQGPFASLRAGLTRTSRAEPALALNEWGEHGIGSNLPTYRRRLGGTNRTGAHAWWLSRVDYQASQTDRRREKEGSAAVCGRTPGRTFGLVADYTIHDRRKPAQNSQRQQ